MSENRSALWADHRDLPRPAFDRIALVLQGGGALGAYQAGVYQALDEAGLEPDWIAGVSIGAINAALVAGSPPGRRIEALRGFWDEVSTDPLTAAWAAVTPPALMEAAAMRTAFDRLGAVSAAMTGVSGMCTPRVPPAWMWPDGSAPALSLYDTSALRASLERRVDFDRINAAPMRFSVGAVNIRTGKFDYFDSTTHRIRADHILASGALPPAFPPVEVDGELYWDGGIVSNTPLQWVADSEPHEDSLIFQVDLWNARGERPNNLAEVVSRQKEIQYASRTRANTDRIRQIQRLKNAVAEALADLPPEMLQRPSLQRLARTVDRKVFRIVHLIYHARQHRGSTKDFEFSRFTAEEHWDAGYADAVSTLRRPEALERPSLAVSDGVATFDVARDG